MAHAEPLGMPEHSPEPQRNQPSAQVIPATPEAGRVTVQAARGLQYFLPAVVWVIALGLIFYYYEAFTTVLLGALAAGSLAAALRPLMRALPGSRGVRGVLAGLLPIVVLIGLLTLAIWQLAGPIRQSFGQLAGLGQRIDPTLAAWSTRLGLSEPLNLQTLIGQVGRFFGGGAGTHLFSKTTSVTGEALVKVVYIFIATIYLLLTRRGTLQEPLLKMLPPRRRPQFQGALDDLEPRLRGWLLGTVVGIVTIGVASWAGYALIGLELAVPLALLSGLSEIVPTAGPAAAYLVAVLFSTTQGLGMVIGVTVVYVIIHVLEAYILQPFIMRRAVRIPPVVTLFSLVFWGKVFGLGGLLLALPLDLLLWSFAEHFLMHRYDEQSTV